MKPADEEFPCSPSKSRDHIMIAHSFRGEVFGPAQALHGATFVGRCGVSSPTRSTRNGIVVDIGRAHEVLKAVLAPLNYRNLDELPQFKGSNTTTEFLTKHHLRPPRAMPRARASSAATAASSRRSASPSRNRTSRAPGTRRRCGEGGVVFAVPGDLATPTGGYAYDRRIIAELAAARLAGRCARPRRRLSRVRAADARAAAGARLAASAPKGRPIVIDGLAFGVLPEAARGAACEPSADRAGASSAGAGDRPERRPRPQPCATSERAALACARHVIVDQRGDRAAAGRRLRRAAGPHHRVAPGHRSRRRRARRSSDGIVRLLAVGAVVPRKGYDVLIAALARSRDLPWRLTIAGDRARDPETAARGSRPTSRVTGLADRVDVLGRRAARSGSPRSMRAPICSCWPRASKATAWPMPRRIAHGLPVVGTTAGAIPDTVPADAGVLVPPDDVGGAGARRCGG